MAIKTLYYVFAIFSAIIFFLLIQEPYFIDIKKPYVNIAKIQMLGIEDYEINEDNVVRVLSAKSAMRFEDKDVLNFVNMSFLKDGFIYDIKGDRGIYINDIVSLEQNVEANRNDGAFFKTSQINYDVNNKIFKTDKYFRFYSKFLNINGNSLEYDMEKKNIVIGSAHAVYEMEEK
ncbi:MAG: LPS export ABC transporter periplasmic protein LptC [Campylobacteraceae bacterium]|nr:LPS export ABC transporter periplasmic protein LptC [Campylobacteraceae bacterium]